MPEGSSITALLGPTNTGKTHRAVERMLAHPSGMIGLPLRLLAREVYDRLTARIGEARVALVTGEEKRVPRRPDYWVCTVEAMPVDREVDFLAVDEIQLAAHAQRGHVFTDRILRARGRQETWFLGSDTMRPSYAVRSARVVPAAVAGCCFASSAMHTAKGSCCCSAATTRAPHQARSGRIARLNSRVGASVHSSCGRAVRRRGGAGNDPIASFIRYGI